MKKTTPLFACLLGRSLTLLLAPAGSSLLLVSSCRSSMAEWGEVLGAMARKKKMMKWNGFGCSRCFTLCFDSTKDYTVMRKKYTIVQ